MDADYLNSNQVCKDSLSKLHLNLKRKFHVLIMHRFCLAYNVPIWMLIKKVTWSYFGGCSVLWKLKLRNLLEFDVNKDLSKCWCSDVFNLESSNWGTLGNLIKFSTFRYLIAFQSELLAKTLNLGECRSFESKIFVNRGRI